MLSARDLIPLVSFFLLRGTCRFCKEKISLQYPIVEFATGMLFVLSVLAFAHTGQELFPLLPLMLFLWSALVVIFVYDLYHFLIPDKVLFPALGAALVFQLILHSSVIDGQFSFAGWEFLLSVLLPGILAAAFFFALFFFSKGTAMGFGDVKFALLMGIFLGYPLIVPALFFAFITGGIIGVLQITLFHKGLRSHIPFGPFLVAGTMFAYLGQGTLFQWDFPFYEIYYLFFLS